MSYCSLGYQQLAALTLYDATGDFVSSQAFTLAAFLTGMGLGALLAERRPPPGWHSLLRLEFALAILGMFTVGYFHLVEMLSRYFLPTDLNLGLFAGTLPWTALFGAMTGLEVPYLLTLNPKISEGRILGWNYFGALLAAVTIPTLFIPFLDVTGTVLVLGALNLLLAASLFPMIRASVWDTALATLVATCAIAWFSIEPTWRETHLKWIYLKPQFHGWNAIGSDLHLLSQLESPIRKRTAYQWIDIVPPEFIERILPDAGYNLYLDRKFQFSSLTHHRYHEAMVHGAASLTPLPPRRVLILGGGDGLLLPELFKYPEIEYIDLVEIDPNMIKLAKENPRLRALNQNALNDPRVRVHVMDAFRFLREGTDRYDLVLADLPYPTSYDLSLLYTVEFYSFLRRRLEPEGILVLDFPPAERSPTAFSVLVHSLRQAGFKSLHAYGAEEPFVAATPSARPLTFDFPKIERFVGNQALLNMISRQPQVEEALASPVNVNSIFSPRLFQNMEKRL
ncbi:MAG: hypothetical protein HC902_03595 [Calothrix sp. SM1_5_4]|nr:hypothetical protein [Calothrix sp. SM1_5_4]